jgi:hypothetical protein
MSVYSPKVSIVNIWERKRGRDTVRMNVCIAGWGFYLLQMWGKDRICLATTFCVDFSDGGRLISALEVIIPTCSPHSPTYNGYFYTANTYCTRNFVLYSFADQNMHIFLHFHTVQSTPFSFITSQFVTFVQHLVDAKYFMYMYIFIHFSMPTYFLHIT